MNREDLDGLLEQIRNIILNKPISENIKSESEELVDLQEAIAYLSNCLSESNEFLKHLSEGELDVKTPSRHNFLAGSLKELHSGLRHLTWQANQVASGDYNQSVSFLGQFSNSFNKMIQQLSEREYQLKQKSTMLSETIDLLKSVMDGVKDWIVVTSEESGEVIYANRSAKQFFFETGIHGHKCEKSCELMKYLQEYGQKNVDVFSFEYSCAISHQTFQLRSFMVQWNDNLAYAHYITDITDEKEYQEHIEEMAYKDELTELYNRRYCIEYLDALLEHKSEFSFCMIDLDGLKDVNDNFGHAAGDAYLKLVSREMAKVTRSTDIVCRIGGDEFAVLFPNCSAEIISGKMGQIDDRLAMLSDDYPMSISYGSIHVEKGSKTSSDFVMAQADEKMYLLKNIRKLKKRNGAGSSGVKA